MPRIILFVATEIFCQNSPMSRSSTGSDSLVSDHPGDCGNRQPGHRRAEDAPGCDVSVHTYTQTDANAFRGNLDFDVLPKDTRTLTRIDPVNLRRDDERCVPISTTVLLMRRQVRYSLCCLKKKK